MNNFAFANYSCGYMFKTSDAWGLIMLPTQQEQMILGKKVVAKVIPDEIGQDVTVIHAFSQMCEDVLKMNKK